VPPHRTGSGNFLILRVARIEHSRGSVALVVVLLDFASASLPAVKKIAKVRDRAEPPRSYSALHQPWGRTSFHVGVYKRSDPDHAAARFPAIGSIGPRHGDSGIAAGIYTQWSQFGSLLDRWMNDQPLREDPSRRRKRRSWEAAK